MKDEKILKAAIEKAIKNGYQPEATGSYQKRKNNIEDIKIHVYRPNNIGIEFLSSKYGGWMQDFQRVIFSHDFAKAFFNPDDEVPIKIENPYHKSGAGGRLEWWQWCLQQMVLEENPLKYLEQFLSPKKDEVG